jgi:hypothetical protein
MALSSSNLKQQIRNALAQEQKKKGHSKLYKANVRLIMPSLPSYLRDCPR